MCFAGYFIVWHIRQESVKKGLVEVVEVVVVVVAF